MELYEHKQFVSSFLVYFKLTLEVILDVALFALSVSSLLLLPFHALCRPVYSYITVFRCMYNLLVRSTLIGAIQMNVNIVKVLGY